MARRPGQHNHSGAKLGPLEREPRSFRGPRATERPRDAYHRCPSKGTDAGRAAPHVPRNKGYANFSPVVIAAGWLEEYAELFAQIEDGIGERARGQLAAEVIFLTHNEGLHEINLG